MIGILIIRSVLCIYDFSLFGDPITCYDIIGPSPESVISKITIFSVDSEVSFVIYACLTLPYSLGHIVGHGNYYVGILNRQYSADYFVKQMNFKKYFAHNHYTYIKGIFRDPLSEVYFSRTHIDFL